MRNFLALALVSVWLPLHAEPLLPDDRRVAYDAALETVASLSGEAIGTLVSALREKYPSVAFREAKDAVDETHDYRAYRWLVAESGTNVYWITPFFNDRDPNTGNIHTQFGRLQFWRGIHDGTPHERRTDGSWNFRFDNEWKALPILRLWNEDATVARVVNLFGAFLRDCGDPAAPADSPYVEPDTPPTILPLDKRLALNGALDTLKALCGEAMRDLCAELRKRFPDVKFRKANGNFFRNDYRNYRWLVATTSKDGYLVTLFSNDVDPNNGCPHTQFGRLQFWMNVNTVGDARLNEKKDGDWHYAYDREWDKLPDLRIWREDCTTERVCELFKEFLSSCSDPAVGP